MLAVPTWTILAFAARSGDAAAASASSLASSLQLELSGSVQCALLPSMYQISARDEVHDATA
jgi:hypothetical protein